MPVNTLQDTRVASKGKVPEKTVAKRRQKKVGGSSKKQEELIDQILQSNLALQHKAVDLMHGMRELTVRMDNMVKLFEEAAGQIKSGTDEPLMKKLEELLDQNKTIAKGLILLEKYVRERASLPVGFQRPPPPEQF